MLKIRYYLILLLLSLLVISLVSIEYAVSAQYNQPDTPTPPMREPNPQELSIDLEVARNQEDFPEVNPDVISNTLGTDDNFVHGLVYAFDYLWASTRTSPPRIIKIDPATLAVINRIELTGTFLLDGGEDIEVAGDYVWMIRYRNPSQLVRVDPDSLVSDVFNMTGLPYGASLESAFGYLWVGGLDWLARVDVSKNPPIITSYDYSGLATYGGVLHALTSSSARLWAGYYQCSTYICDEFDTQLVMIINPASPAAPEEYISTSTNFFPDDITYVGSHMYASTENNSGDPSYLYRFEEDLTYIPPNLAYNQISFGTFRNPLDPLAFWAAYAAYNGDPGRILRFDLSLTQLNSIALPSGSNSPSEIAFDTRGNMYVSTWQTPSRIVKYFAPAADAGADQTVVDSNMNGSEYLTLDGSDSNDNDGTIVSYIWSEDGSQIATGVNPTVSFNVGIHNVTLRVTDNDGLNYTDTVVITVVEEGQNVGPAANAGTDQTVIDGDNSGAEDVILDGSGSVDSDGTIASYVWSEGGSQIATGSNPTVSFAVGSHEVILQVTDDDGAIGTDKVFINVIEAGQNLGPTADAGADQQVDDNDNSGAEEVILDGSGSSDSDGTIISYVWSEGGDQIATGVNPTVSFTVGTHNVTLQVIDNDGAIASDTVIISVNQIYRNVYIPIVIRSGE